EPGGVGGGGRSAPFSLRAGARGPRAPPRAASSRPAPPRGAPSPRAEQPALGNRRSRPFHQIPPAPALLGPVPPGKDLPHIGNFPACISRMCLIVALRRRSYG